MMPEAEARLRRALAEGAALNLFAHCDAGAILRRAADAPGGGPLAGLIVGLKDNIAVAGFACTAGLAARRGHRAAMDAHVTARLSAAGAVLIPGLAMDEAALGAAGDNPLSGRCANPAAPGASPGGSSAGSAAIVAAGLADAALGTDTLGSVRIPAACCGVLGLKPTRGLIGRGGVVALAPSLDTLGLLARGVGPLRALLAVLAGPDPDDPASRPAPAGAAGRPVAALRVAIPEPVESVPLHADAAAALTRARDALAGMGVAPGRCAMPGWRPSALRRAAFLWTEAEAAVALADDLAQPGGVSPGLARLIAFGRDAAAGQLVAAMAEMEAARAALDRAFTGADLLLTPTLPAPAVDHGTPPPATLADFTALANVAGVPALALPVALPGGGRPVSVQLIAPHWGEGLLLDLGARLAPLLAQPR